MNMPSNIKTVMCFFFSLDLNAAESGVQHKPSTARGNALNSDQAPSKESCSC